MGRQPNNTLPSGLPQVFNWQQATEAGISDRRLKRLVADRVLEKIEHGLYQRASAAVGDLALIATSLIKLRATICLSSALAEAGLIDEIPSTIHIALVRGTRRPKTSLPITWHFFSPITFDVGRDDRRYGRDLPIASYTAERSICDAYRMRHTQGVELGREALKNWVRRPEHHAAQLLKIASHFPRASTAIRLDLELLL